MPEPLQASEVHSKTDPSVNKQWDSETPLSDQFNDFGAIADKLQVALLTTIRPNVGPVARSMAVAKRNGPDFLFLANTHSQKFEDIKNSSQAQITFQNSSTQDWISVTGKVTTSSNDDPRIKDLYNPSIKAWFGDLGDGKHTGTYEDPRMAVIEVKADYIAYWKSTSTALGFAKEVGMAVLKGQVANTGVQRQFQKAEIEQMRNMS